MYMHIYNYYLLPIPIQINIEIQTVTYFLKNKILAELTQTVEKKINKGYKHQKAIKSFA